MAQAVYSQRLFIAHAITAGELDVAEGDTAVIMYAFAFYPGLPAAAVLQLIDLATDATIFYSNVSILSGGSNVAGGLNLRIVLPPGSKTGILCISPADVVLSGYLLSQP